MAWEAWKLLVLRLHSYMMHALERHDAHFHSNGGASLPREVSEQILPLMEQLQKQLTELTTARIKILRDDQALRAKHLENDRLEVQLFGWAPAVEPATAAIYLPPGETGGVNGAAKGPKKTGKKKPVDGEDDEELFKFNQRTPFRSLAPNWRSAAHRYNPPHAAPAAPWPPKSQAARTRPPASTPQKKLIVRPKAPTTISNPDAIKTLPATALGARFAEPDPGSIVPPQSMPEVARASQEQSEEMQIAPANSDYGAILDSLPLGRSKLPEAMRRSVRSLASSESAAPIEAESATAPNMPAVATLLPGNGVELHVQA